MHTTLIKSYISSLVKFYHMDVELNCITNNEKYNTAAWHVARHTSKYNPH